MNDTLVEEARATELVYFHSKGVWLKVPKADARRITGKPAVTVRWVDANKGDEYTPEISVTMQCVINLTFQFLSALIH